jgi:hypothetical protein
MMSFVEKNSEKLKNILFTEQNILFNLIIPIAIGGILRNVSKYKLDANKI